MCKQNTVCHISLGHRGSHPTSGEHWGKCFMHAPAHAGQCGTGSSRGAWWSTCVTLDPYPLKPPDACTSLSGGLHCLWSILPACYILPSSSRLCFCTSRYLWAGNPSASSYLSSHTICSGWHAWSGSLPGHLLWSVSHISAPILGVQLQKLGFCRDYFLPHLAYCFLCWNRLGCTLAPLLHLSGDLYHIAFSIFYSRPAILSFIHSIYTPP